MRPTHTVSVGDLQDFSFETTLASGHSKRGRKHLVARTVFHDEGYAVTVFVVKVGTEDEGASTHLQDAVDMYNDL